MSLNAFHHHHVNVDTLISTPSEGDITSDLQELYVNFKKCMELRDKYMEYSAQRLFDNPKDKDDWKIYPEPLAPSWPLPPAEEWEKRRQQEAKRAADPIGSVGNDFHMEDCVIPPKHEVRIRSMIGGIPFAVLNIISSLVRLSNQ